MTRSDCRTVDVNGTSVTVRGNGRPLTQTDLDALAEFVRVLRSQRAAPVEPSVESLPLFDPEGGQQP